MSIEPKVEEIRRQMVQIARDMLGGDVSFIEGARLISRLRWDAKLPEFDRDIDLFVGISSETEALPVGEERRHWAPEALIRLQPEIEKAERWAQKIGRPACKKVIDRFGPTPRQ